MNWRELLVLGSTAIAWPLTALAQQKAKQHRITVIAAVLPVFRITETEGGTPWRAFFGELRRLGYVEDGNLIVERYSAEGQPERAAELAQHVVSRNPDLTVTGTGFLMRAVAAATDRIPIVSSLPEGLEARDCRQPGSAGPQSHRRQYRCWNRDLG